MSASQKGFLEFELHGSRVLNSMGCNDKTILKCCGETETELP